MTPYEARTAIRAGTCPAGVHVSGSLSLCDTPITTLPDGLRVDGSLHLEGTLITALPKNLHVRWSLNLEGTSIVELPENLYIGGSLYLIGTSVTALPKNFHVGKSLDLSGTPVPVIYDDTSRGYQLRAIRCGKAWWWVAGCRVFRSDVEALVHWGGPGYPDPARGARYVAAIRKHIKGRTK